MSFSKYASTPHTTNLARTSRLILGPCADVMRDILLKKVPVTILSKTVKSWIDSQKRNPLNKSQSDLIFPPPSNIYYGDYSDMDISLLYILLRNVTNLPAHNQGWGNDPDPTDRSVSANIERLRLIRNKYYGHVVHIGMPNADFQAEFCNIRTIVKEVECWLGVPKYQLLHVVDFIKTETMDPEREREWIDKLTLLESLVSDVEQHAKEICELKLQVENKAFGNFDIDIKSRIDTTKAALENQTQKISKVFVHTRATQRVLELVETNRYVVIKGNPGAGKTTIAMHVLTVLQKRGMFPLQVTTVQDFYGPVSPFSNVALFLDNLFGEFSMSNEVDNFDAKIHLIKAMCNNDNAGRGNVLIVTIRNDIYNEALQRTNPELFFEKSSIDISKGDFQLQNAEIMEFFEKYDLEKLLKSLDVSKIGKTIGIPQCCNLVKKKSTLSEDALGFFNDPMQSLEKYIKQILDRKECKMAVLAYILLCGGSVEKSVLEAPQKDGRSKEEALKMIGAKESSLRDFQNSIHLYRDFLVILDTNDSKYRFSHSSVQESLFKCLVNYYPKEVIKSCDYVLLERLTTCKKLSWNSILITEDIFPDIIERMLEMLKEGSVSAFRTISRLQIWEEENFMNECENNQRVLNGLKQNTDKGEQTMLVHFSVSGKIRWVKYLLPSSSQKQRYMSLNEACAHNQKDIVDLLLETDVKYDLKTCFYAVQSGNLDMLYRFTDNVDLHEKTSSNNKDLESKVGLLHEICCFGQNHLIKPVLERFPNLIHVQDEEGGNALHSVAFAGDEATFRSLVESGFDPYSRSHYGSTALHYACQNGKLNMVRYICNTYPNLLSKEYNDKEGQSPLHWSAQSGNINLYEYLIEKGIQQTVSACQRTPLHEACSTGKLDMCKYLVKAYPSLLDVKDNDGENALHAAACGGNVDLFEFLLKKGFDIKTTRNDGKTVLHLCCCNGHLYLCKYLVKVYPHLLVEQDNEGENALHDAVRGGSIDLVNVLLEHGVKIESKRNDGKSVLHLCCMKRQLDICKYLVKYHPHLLHVEDNNGGNALHAAAWGGNIDLFKFMLEQGFQIETARGDGKTVLHLGCMNGQLDICKFLVNYYPHLLDFEDNKRGNALHAAAWGGNIDLFKFMLEQGFKIETTRSDEKTVLQLCRENEKQDLVNYLENTYPNKLDVTDSGGQTALQLSMSQSRRNRRKICVIF